MSIRISTLLLAASTMDANAFCTTPSFYASAPSHYGSKPNVPYCLQGAKWSGGHTCEQYEIDSYVAEVEEYVEELDRYAQQTVDFANETRDFAQSAMDYARCEAEDVQTQHE